MSTTETTTTAGRVPLWRSSPGLTAGQRASLHRMYDVGVSDDELDAMAGRIRLGNGWRSLAGRLTADQFAELESREATTSVVVLMDMAEAMVSAVSDNPGATVTALPSSPLDACIGRHPAGSKLTDGGLPAVLAGIARDTLTAADRRALASLLTCRSCDGPLRAPESVEAGFCGLCRVAGGAA